MRVFHKWLAIITIPLAFEVAFIAVFLFLLDRADEEVAVQRKAQAVQEALQQIRGDEIGFLLCEYVLTKEPGAEIEFREKLAFTNALIGRIRTMSASIPSQTSALDKVQSTWKEMGYILDSAKTQSEFKDANTLRRMSMLDRALVIARFGELLDKEESATQELLAYQTDLDEEMRQRNQWTRLLLRGWLLIGITTNILLSALLAIYFGNNIRERIARLKSNSVRLGLDQQLLPLTTGEGDEIAECEEVFYNAATAMKDSLDRERANFDNATDTIFALDGSGRIIRVNETFQKTLGYARDDVLQSHLVVYLSPDSRDAFREVLKVAQQEGGKRHELETGMLTTDGARKVFAWSVIWIPDQKLYMCVGHDITDKKILENAKQQFVAMLSHDIGGPLAAIVATFELATGGAFGPLPGKLQDKLDNAQKSVVKIMSLINELLDLEKFEAGKLDLEITRLFLSRVVAQALDSVHKIANQKKVGIKIDVSENLLIYADSERILRVISTILLDAVNNSREGGSVQIEASEQEMFVELKITDYRPEIPKEQLDTIFERYKQPEFTDSNSAKQRSNISLAVAKAIMIAHGGSLWITSASREGTTFRLQVPKA